MKINYFENNDGLSILVKEYSVDKKIDLYQIMERFLTVQDESLFMFALKNEDKKTYSRNAPELSDEDVYLLQFVVKFDEVPISVQLANRKQGDDLIFHASVGTMEEYAEFLDRMMSIIIQSSKVNDHDFFFGSSSNQEKGFVNIELLENVLGEKTKNEQ